MRGRRPSSNAGQPERRLAGRFADDLDVVPRRRVRVESERPQDGGLGGEPRREGAVYHVPLALEPGRWNVVELPITRDTYTSPDSGYMTLPGKFYYSNAEHDQLPAETSFTANASAIPVFDIDGDGQWHSTDRYGIRRGIKNPVEQAKSSKHQLLKKLKESSRWSPRFICVRHGVILTDNMLVQLLDDFPGGHLRHYPSSSTTMF